MASYTGNYTNDLKQTFNQVSLNVYLINSAVEAETRTTTTKEYDDRYLPSVLKNSFLDLRAVCTITQGTRSIRQGIVRFNETESLYIPCPFIGGSEEFEQFFRELVALPEAVLVELSRETIDAFYTKTFSVF